jgi:hypothetical protein
MIPTVMISIWSKLIPVEMRKRPAASAAATLRSCSAYEILRVMLAARRLKLRDARDFTITPMF